MITGAMDSQYFVDLKSNLALLYNKGNSFGKSILTRKIPLNWIFPY